MNRHIWLRNTAMTPTELCKGRFMRAPDHPADGVENSDNTGTEDSTQNKDNQNGNSGDSGNTDRSQDNNGQSDGVTGFWDKKPEDSSGSDDSTEKGKAIGAELAGIIQGAQFDPVFTDEVKAKIAEGDFGAANEAIAKSHQQAMTQSVGVFARLISAYGERMEAQMQSRIDAALGNLKSTETLEQAFPEAAKNPAARPLIERAFEQALINTKGNREEAVKQTREMLKVFGASTGLTTPPADPNGSSLSGSAKSLVDELLENT